MKIPVWIPELFLMCTWDDSLAICAEAHHVLLKGKQKCNWQLLDLFYKLKIANNSIWYTIGDWLSLYIDISMIRE